MVDDVVQGNDDARLLRDYVITIVNGTHSSIAWPAIQANTFEIKPDIIQMI